MEGMRHGRAPGERVLHGTGGVGGAARKSVVRRSTLKEAGAELRREAHVGRATLTADARLAGKQEKERALAAIKSARMRDPAYWCAAAGADGEEEAAEAEEEREEEAEEGGGAAAGAGASEGGSGGKRNSGGCFAGGGGGSGGANARALAARGPQGGGPCIVARNVKAQRGADGVDRLAHELFDDRGLARVVQAQHQQAHFLFRLLDLFKDR
jgi:hypothetical protein